MRRDGNLQSYFSTKILAIFWLYNDVQMDDRQEGSETTLSVYVYMANFIFQLSNK